MPRLTLRAARVNAGFTQAMAAKQLNISVSTLKRWETCKSYPKQPEIEKLCKLYDIDYDFIFFGK